MGRARWVEYDPISIKKRKYSTQKKKSLCVPVTVYRYIQARKMQGRIHKYF